MEVPVEPEKNVFLGIHLKKETSRWNLLAIPYVFFISNSIGGYINVQIIYLLRDSDYFNMDVDYSGRITSNILLIAIFCGLFWTAIAGLIYDYFSRKIPMFLACSVGSFLLLVCPHTAPSVLALSFVRSCIMICQATI